jgi:glycosyltransferase involved in cell wall biosynthesis
VWTCHLAENKADSNPILRGGYRGALRYLDARTDATIAVSGLLRDWLVSQGIGRDRIAVIPNGVDCSVFRPMPRDPGLISSLGLDPGSPIVGAVARLTEQKGIDTLVTAAVEVQRTVPDAQFLLVGSGPLEETLREQATATGARVVFAGERRNVPEILGLFDIAVVPSRWEGAFCFSLLEAMASGTPVVCSDIPVFTDVVSSGAAATVFSVDDPSDLARALLSMLQEPERAQRTAEEGMRLVRERFSSELSSRATVDVYERLLEGEPS